MVACSSSSRAVWNFWSPFCRVLVLALAGTSLGSLIADFYGVCSLRVATLWIFVPSSLLLTAAAALDCGYGNGMLLRSLRVGLIGGLIASVAYDLFRLPFVLSHSMGWDAVIPPLTLFKVFPRFGAMILNQPLEQTSYSFAAHLVGWFYHFTNGATIGICYLACVGNPARRHWLWAMLLATGLELGMLATPYPAVFSIPITTRFVIVTMTAHTVFGITLGVAARTLTSRR